MTGLGSVDQVIRAHARRIGDRPALVACGRSEMQGVTWRDLDTLTGRLAARLRESAVRRSPACLVASLSKNDLTEVLALIACLRVDAPVLAVSGRQPQPMREAFLAEVRRSGYALVLATSTPPDVMDAITPLGPAPIGPDRLLLASGGSTGRPKLVVDRIIRATPARPAAVRPYLSVGWRAGQRQLVCSPLYHAGGLTPFVEGLVSGNTSYLLPPVFDGQRIGEIIDQHSIDWLQMTPFHMSAVLTGTRGPATWRGSPRLIHVADHCPPRVKRAFHEALGPTHVYEMYAASEGIGMTMARGDEWDARPGTVGRGFFTKLRVADDEGRPLAPYETGEVYMRSGARVRDAYLGAAGRVRVDPYGFATLGDIGHLDEEKYLFLRPRQIATISVAGVTVVPAEVEAELMENPQVADVGVCSDASSELGERVVAAVVPAAEGLTENAIRRWARVRLSPAQIPARCVFVPALPRADTGKLDREALFALVSGPAKVTRKG